MLTLEAQQCNRYKNGKYVMSSSRISVSTTQIRVFIVLVCVSRIIPVWGPGCYYSHYPRLCYSTSRLPSLCTRSFLCTHKSIQRSIPILSIFTREGTVARKYKWYSFVQINPTFFNFAIVWKASFFLFLILWYIR